MLLSLGGDRRQEPLLPTPYNEVNAELSPNGRWLAYQSNESSHYEIYVRPFPNVTAGKWQVSTSGGTRPLWARNGQELFYESMGTLMRVPLPTGSTFTYGTPTKLFDAAPYFFGPAPGGRTYDVSPDGQRFLMIKEGGEADEPAPSARLVLVQQLVRGTEAPRADEVIAAYVTHSRRQPRLVTISRAVFGDPPRTRSNRTISGATNCRFVPMKARDRRGRTISCF